MQRRLVKVGDVIGGVNDVIGPPRPATCSAVKVGDVRGRVRDVIERVSGVRIVVGDAKVRISNFGIKVGDVILVRVGDLIDRVSDVSQGL